MRQMKLAKISKSISRLINFPYDLQTLYLSQIPLDLTQRRQRKTLTALVRKALYNTLRSMNLSNKLWSKLQRPSLLLRKKKLLNHQNQLKRRRPLKMTILRFSLTTNLVMEAIPFLQLIQVTKCLLTHILNQSSSLRRQVHLLSLNLQNEQS